MMKTFSITTMILLGLAATGWAQGTFDNEVCTQFSMEGAIGLHAPKEAKLPAENILALGLLPEGIVASTPEGLIQFDGETWQAFPGPGFAAQWLATPKNVLVAADATQMAWFDGTGWQALALPEGVTITTLLKNDLAIATSQGAYVMDVWRVGQPSGQWQRVQGSKGQNVLSLALSAKTVVGLADRAVADGESLLPEDDNYRWAPREVSVLTYDVQGRLWMGCDQGVACLDGVTWSLYTGAEGLPYKYFTCIAAGPKGEIWFGTARGAIRYDGTDWDYRANLRWLRDDQVNDIVVDGDGTAWIATPKGVSRIERIPMTLEKKAAYFEDQVEKRHNRDGYITNWHLTRRGDVYSAEPGITDNDGLYTAWYGAAMSFKYAVTKDPQAKALAKRSFEACKGLIDVVPDEMNGVDMRGFVARVKIPVDWHEPVNEQYGPEYNASKQKGDPFWKQITPRFPLSADGKHRWKNDTSSDELSGHYFLYAIYYDLVAETEEEKAPVREAIAAITDHLIRNDFNLIDHDGKPTRWGRFGPGYMYSNHGWSQVGLNSMMMLAFLETAEHITGDAKYAEVAQMLRDEHRYHINAMVARPTYPPANVVPWDNNLAMACFYPLYHYEDDPELLLLYRQSVEDLWMFVSKQKNSLWNYIYAACVQRFQQLVDEKHFDGAFPDSGPYTEYITKHFYDCDPQHQDSLDTLQSMPLELIGWRMYNSHRLDITLDNTPGQEANYGWSKVDGKALPIDERGHVRQDRDAYMLDLKEDEGHSEHEGTFYLLPYWMARYHGFLE